jgi:hypothetical protein
MGDTARHVWTPRRGSMCVRACRRKKSRPEIIIRHWVWQKKKAVRRADRQAKWKRRQEELVFPPILSTCQCAAQVKFRFAHKIEERHWPFPLRRALKRPRCVRTGRHGRQQRMSLQAVPRIAHTV